MKEIMSFLGDVNKPVAIATVDGDKPKVRFFSFKMEENGNLYFITSEHKEVYRQLKENNNIEICSLQNEEFQWIRIEGKVEFIKDVELNIKAFTMLPLLERAYGSPENESIVLLKIVDMKANKFSLTGQVEELEV